MNKNTVWAIVLSTVVIFVSYFVLPLIFPSLRPVDSQAIEATADSEENVENQVEELELNATDTAIAEADVESENEPEVQIEEETITVVSFLNIKIWIQELVFRFLTMLIQKTELWLWRLELQITRL